MDELAALAGIDPVEFRRRHLDDPRLRAVLDAVVDRAGWTARPRRRGPRSGPRNGRGIAIGVEKGGRVATYAEVRVPPSRTVEIARIITAYECGAIVNPQHLKGQVEGGTIMALGGALWEAIHFDRGRILNGRLSDDPVPRFLDVPPIEVLLLDRTDLPSAGGGATPLIAVAPAIANAIDDATGERIRHLPLLPGGRLPTGAPGRDSPATKN
ncbi:MAG: molybdopterin cofactor-binding domain-containing protein [Thermoplasmata archaeon]